MFGVQPFNSHMGATETHDSFEEWEDFVQSHTPLQHIELEFLVPFYLGQLLLSQNNKF